MLFRYSQISASKISAPDTGFELREGSKVINFLVKNFDPKKRAEYQDEYIDNEDWGKSVNKRSVGQPLGVDAALDFGTSSLLLCSDLHDRGRKLFTAPVCVCIYLREKDMSTCI